MTIDNSLWYTPPNPGGDVGKPNSGGGGGGGYGPKFGVAGKINPGSSGGSGYGPSWNIYTGKPNEDEIMRGSGGPGTLPLIGSGDVKVGAEYYRGGASPWFGGTMLAAGFPVANALAGAGGGPWFDQPRGPERQAQTGKVNGVSGVNVGNKRNGMEEPLLKGYSMQGTPVQAQSSDRWNNPRAINPQYPFVPQNVESSLREKNALQSYQTGLMAKGDYSDVPRYFTPADALPVAMDLAAQGVTVIDETTGQERPINEQDLLNYQQTYYQPKSPWHLLPGALQQPTKPTTSSGGYPKTWWGYGGGGGGGYSGGGNWQDYLMNLTTWRGL